MLSKHESKVAEKLKGVCYCDCYPDVKFWLNKACLSRIAYAAGKFRM